GEIMDNKLLILLKNLGIENEAEGLNDGKITKVFVSKDDSYTFYLSFQKLIQFNEYQLLIQNKDNFPFPIKYVIDYENDDFTQEELLPYIGYLLEVLKQKYPVCLTLTTDNFKVGPIIKIGACNTIQLEQLTQLKSEIESLFNQTGIKRNFDFYLDEENDTFKDNKEEMETYEPVEIDMSLLQKTEKPSMKENTFQNKYRKKSNAVDMKIEEITDQTLDNNICIKGYVFKTDMIVTKSN